MGGLLNDQIGARNQIWYRWVSTLSEVNTVIVEDIGYYIMIGLLVAAAGYSVAGKGKPRPKLSKGKRNLAIICFVIALVCALLVAMISLLPGPARH
jgi:hypothetical protein